MAFGERDHWEKELKRARSKLEDVDIHIDGLLCDVNDLKSQRAELEQEYNDIKAEIDAIDRREEKEIHAEMMETSPSYRALHTPSREKDEAGKEPQSNIGETGMPYL